MSKSAVRLSYAEGIVTASFIKSILYSVCERVEIAGSLRRKAETVGDIELVCIPKMTMDLFGGGVYNLHSIDEVMSGYTFLKGKDHYRQYDIGSILLDLFITTPEQWGVIFTLRTGPSDFSKKLVTKRKAGGLMPSYLTVKEGRVWYDGKALDTPEETDLFKAFGLDFIKPEDR